MASRKQRTRGELDKEFDRALERWKQAGERLAALGYPRVSPLAISYLKRGDEIAIAPGKLEEEAKEAQAFFDFLDPEKRAHALLWHARTKAELTLVWALGSQVKASETRNVRRRNPRRAELKAERLQMFQEWRASGDKPYPWTETNCGPEKRYGVSPSNARKLIAQELARQSSRNT